MAGVCQGVMWRTYPSFPLNVQEVLPLDALMGALTSVQLQQIVLAGPTMLMAAAMQADQVEDILTTKLFPQMKVAISRS